MATVRINRELQTTVRNNISKMFDERIDKLSRQVHASTIGYEVVSRVLGPLQPVIHTLMDQAEKLLGAKQSFPYVKKAYVKIPFKRITPAEGEELYGGIVFSYGFSLFPLVYCPLEWENATFPFDNNTIATPQDASFNHISDLVSQIDLLSREKDLLLTQISKIFASATTLKQVVDVFPSVLDFVDADVREKHYAESYKTKRKVKEIPALDDAAKTALIKARLITGG